jgi:glutathione synthase/RimK-type ligase-like ATP-grasp enzyme
VLLLVTSLSDLHADVVVAECAKRGAPLIRFNTDQYSEFVTLDLRLSDACWAGTLTIRGHLPVALSDVKSVWYRGFELRDSGSMNQADQRFRDAEISSTLSAFTTMLTDCNWVSLPAAVDLAENKPRQLALAMQHGLTVPKTVLTTELPTIREFLRDSRDLAVAKRLSSPRRSDPIIYTTQFFTHDLEGHEGEFRSCPTLVQELIPKAADVRVVVVGDTIFAVTIRPRDRAATVIDWRGMQLNELEFAPHELPASVSDALVRLTASLGLRYSSPDLILTPDGEYVFLELNPNGQWAWIESITGLPITAKVVDILLYP